MEPAGISDAFAKVRPLNVAIEGTVGTMGIDVTVASNPPSKGTLKKQIEANKTNLRNFKKKLQDLSCSTHSKYTNDDILTAAGTTGHQQKISTSEAGAIVIGEMLNKGI
eukprot:7810733-Ditylum_brightwellii.AAC.1